MRDFLKVGLIAFVAAFLGALLAITVVGGFSQSPASVGGYTEGYWDSADGYKVDGTTVITGAGVITGTSQTLSSTLTVTGETIVGAFTQGGACFATSTASSGAGDATLTQAQLEAYSCFITTVNTQDNQAWTLPATSTWTTLLSGVGESKRWIIKHATSTAAVTFTLLKGAGVDLIGVSNANDVIDGAEYMQLTCTRETSTDVDCIVDELVAAD